jgi:Raf kinase inhibitor-like YbhB/YbcL family protein
VRRSPPVNLGALAVSAAILLVQAVTGNPMPVVLHPLGGAEQMAFTLHTPSFKQGGDIPKKYTCDGADLSPAFNWTEPPATTATLTLIADDPDAPVGNWNHWVLFDIPAGARDLGEGRQKTDQLADGSRQGRNDFKRIGYGGPCPPPGKPHRYFFRLYALDAKLDLPAGSTKAEVESAMKGHVLAQAEVMGKYHR